MDERGVETHRMPRSRLYAGVFLVCFAVFIALIGLGGRTKGPAGNHSPFIFGPPKQWLTLKSDDDIGPIGKGIVGVDVTYEIDEYGMSRLAAAIKGHKGVVKDEITVEIQKGDRLDDDCFLGWETLPLDGIEVHHAPNISDLAVERICRIETLVYVGLIDVAGVTEVGFSRVAARGFRAIDLSHNSFKPYTLSKLGESSQVRTICLTDCDNIDDSIFPILSRCRSLESIDLTNCRRIQGTDFARLFREASVKTLTLTGTSVDNEFVLGLADVPSLKHVEMYKVSCSREVIRKTRAKRPDMELFSE